MSEFDEEAERERLREQFEREEEKREATERMSELLLQGATMTNAHCSDCGDPIFRYDNQEFCATCEKPVERAERDDEGSDADAADDTVDDERSDATTNIEVTRPSDEARVRFGAADEEDDVEASGTDDEQSRSQRPPARGSTSTDAEAAIASARADLAATLQRFARAARESESPAEAKAQLEAAREAAEALDELD